MPQKTQLALLTMARLVEALAGGSRRSFIIFQLRSFLPPDGSGSGMCWPFLLPYAVNAVLKLSCAAMIALWLQGMRPGFVKKSTKKGKQVSIVPKWVGHVYRRHLGRQPRYELVPNQEYELEDGEGQHSVANGKEEQQSISIWTWRLLLTLAARALVTMHIFSYPSLLLILVSTPRYNPAGSDDSSASSATASRSFHSKSSANSTSQFVQVPAGYHVHLPFVFTGGLASRLWDLAAVLAIRGAVGCLLQLVFFPRLCAAVGKMQLYRCALLVFPVTYFATPYLAAVASSTARSMALPAGAMLLNAACPDPGVLGTVNGIGASVAAGARGLGHLLMTGWLYGVGLENGVVGVAWWGMAGIATMAAIAAACVPEPPADEPVADEAWEMCVVDYSV